MWKRILQIGVTISALGFLRYLIVYDILGKDVFFSIHSGEKVLTSFLLSVFVVGIYIVGGEFE